VLIKSYYIKRGQVKDPSDTSIPLFGNFCFALVFARLILYYIIIEQATASKYISIFMTYPTAFANLDVNIKACSNFIRFVNKKMPGFNSEMETWSNIENSLIRKNF
jgi:hypothetical protein